MNKELGGASVRRLRF